MKAVSFLLAACALGAFALASAACGKTEATPKTVANDERPSCSSAGDCVLTTFSGCCSCCEGAPHAVLKSELHRQEGSCAAVSCAACAENIECAKVERLDAFYAVCKDGTCVAEKKKE